MTWQTYFRAPRAETTGVSYVPKMLACPTYCMSSMCQEFWCALRAQRVIHTKKTDVTYVLYKSNEIDLSHLTCVQYMLKNLTCHAH